MLQHQNEGQGPQVAAEQVRVRPEELAKAIAALEARKAGASSDPTGTVLIGNTVRQLALDVTPEAVWAEIQLNRSRDECLRRELIRRKRVHLARCGAGALAMIAIIWGIILSRTVYNPLWQAKHQRQVFVRDLAQTLGPHPRLHIVVAPDGPLLQNSYWGDPMTFPITEVPDGYFVHSGSEAPIRPSWFLNVPLEDPTLRVIFVDARDLMNDDAVHIRHNGIDYLHGWIPRWQIPSLLSHRQFDFVSSFQITPYAVQSLGSDWYHRRHGASPKTQSGDFVALTIPATSVEQQDAQYGGMPDGTTIYDFPDGQNLGLDKYAWETDGGDT